MPTSFREDLKHAPQRLPLETLRHFDALPRRRICPSTFNDLASYNDVAYTYSRLGEAIPGYSCLQSAFSV